MRSIVEYGKPAAASTRSAPSVCRIPKPPANAKYFLNAGRPDSRQSEPWRQRAARSPRIGALDFVTGNSEKYHIQWLT
ncbi:MAG: hypothetical protein IZT59_14500 [Verrucomicrobia bacterium]|nr:hypothetical protein [Verrucomicrobiota bacterium]